MRACVCVRLCLGACSCICLFHGPIPYEETQGREKEGRYRAVLAHRHLGKQVLAASPETQDWAWETLKSTSQRLGQAWMTQPSESFL